jgi:hypothetical protein
LKMRLFALPEDDAHAPNVAMIPSFTIENLKNSN